MINCCKSLAGNNLMGSHIRIGLTTVRDHSGRNHSEIEKTALGLASAAEALYVPRDGHGLAALKRLYGIDRFLVLNKEGHLTLEGEPPLYWHPGMALLRLRRLLQGKGDKLLNVTGLKPGDQVLDCTMGFGADALLLAYGAGREGGVTALEASPVIACLTQNGIHRYRDTFTRYGLDLTCLFQRIRMYVCLAGDFLEAQPDRTYDVVYWDPMFQKGLSGSSSMNALRDCAWHERLDPALIRESLRAARRLVALKQNAGSGEFRRLGCHRVLGGKYSPVAYGIWDKEGSNT
jgi:hypothetical protein